MHVRFANSYVERLFTEKYLLGLHHLISVLSLERELPEEFWLFCRLLEWTGSTRSGVWQYYEALPESTYERMRLVLKQLGLTEIAEKYSFGKSSWEGPDQASELDASLNVHEEEIGSVAFKLIAARKDDLKFEA